MLAVAGCDQPKGNQTGNETTLEDEPNALQADGPVEPQASTAREIPGGTEASKVSSRRLLDNVGANNNLDTFARLLQTTGLTKKLSGTGPYTVFAPTEAAFNALPDSLRENLSSAEHRQQLQELVSNHIIAGKLTTEDLQDGAMLKTAAGRQLRVSKRDGKVRINRVLIEDPDAMSSNGVLHTINAVLVPEKESQ